MGRKPSMKGGFFTSRAHYWVLGDHIFIDSRINNMDCDFYKALC